MSTADAIEADLEKLPSAIRKSGLAEAARTLATAIDCSTSLRDLAAAVKELRATMADLETRAIQAPEERDPIDEAENRGPAAIPISSARSYGDVGS